MIDDDQVAKALEALGWSVKTADPVEHPRSHVSRYNWLPDEVVDFLNNFTFVIAPDEKSWLITRSEMVEKSDSAFVWDQWEQDSLAAASGDESWQQSIKDFWDSHFIILMSVKNSYSYISINKELSIVGGEEPEFEETEIVAENFADFLGMLCSNDGALARWV